MHSHAVVVDGNRVITVSYEQTEACTCDGTAEDFAPIYKLATNALNKAVARATG